MFYSGICCPFAVFLRFFIEQVYGERINDRGSFSSIACVRIAKSDF